MTGKMIGSLQRLLVLAVLSLTVGLSAPCAGFGQPADASSQMNQPLPPAQPLAPTPTQPPPGQSTTTQPAGLTTDQTQPDTSGGVTDASYVLGPQDVIEVAVLGRNDFTTRARVGEDGMIQLPFLGTLQAAKKTTTQLSADIGQALEKGGYFSNPILRVEIVAYASRYVTVLGAVATPGLVPVDRPYHLSEILARVGGTREDAAEYLIVRPENGPEQHYSIRALITGDPSQDPNVSPGDRILIPKADLFYISGQVKSPGAFGLESGMTLRQAIARAGGLTDIGNDHGVKVTGADGKVRTLQLDEPVEAKDVIVVGERLF
jgi:polysaccharide biosynthesis/export protein